VIGPFGSDLKTSDYRDSGIPLVFVRHIRSGNFSGLRPQFVAEDKARQLAAHLARPGDILVTKMGDPPGDAAIYPSGMPDAIVTADCIRWRPSNVLTAAFLVEWINSHAGQRWIASKTKGVAQQKITLALFRSMPVPVPPADEVAVISRELERLRLELADLADAESDCAALSPVLRQSILAAAFRGDLA
jgi:type I restriction enzyme S subunit